MREYLSFHHRIDVALDPFPYNGGTTSMHSLWMGVPVITLAGQHTASRVGVAVLARAGLDEFIANSEEDYFQRAVQVTKDLKRLNDLRGALRSKLENSTSGGQAVVQNVEASYREMWLKWCQQ